MNLKHKISTIAVTLTMAAVTTLGLSTTASASTTADYIGDGYPNNPHGVWCIQEALNYFQAHRNSGYGHWPIAIPVLSQDGIWGPQTKQAVWDFQHDYNSVPTSAPRIEEDGIVGPTTGSLILGYGDPYYDGYIFNEPNAYCYQYVPTAA